MKILVVDDSTVQRKAIMRVIQQAGFSNPILEASNGQEAIQLLAANYQDVCLILCDWGMPVMSGIDFIGGVCKIPELKKIPVVMVTAVGTESSIKEIRQMHPSIVAYVVKPFTQEQLGAAIAPYVRS